MNLYVIFIYFFKKRSVCFLLWKIFMLAFLNFKQSSLMCLMDSSSREKCFMHEQLLLDSAHLWTSIHSTTVDFRALTISYIYFEAPHFPKHHPIWATSMKFVLECSTTSTEFTIPSMNTGPWCNFREHWSIVAELIYPECDSKKLRKNFRDLIPFLGRDQFTKLS